MSAVCTGDLTSAVFTAVNTVFIAIINQEVFNLYFRNGNKQGGGSVISTQRICDRRFHYGPASDLSTTGVSLARVSLAGGTGYRPLPCLTHIKIKHNGTHSYVFNVRWLLGRRLNSGQTPFRHVIMNRHVFILRMHTTPIHDGHAPDCLHNQRFFFFLFFLVLLGGRSRLQAAAYQEQKPT